MKHAWIIIGFLCLAQTYNIARLRHGISAIDSAALVTLSGIARSEYPSAAYAQALVMLYSERTYEPIFPEFPNGNGGNSLRKPIEEVIKVYPNPGRDFVNVTIPTDIPTASTKLYLYNSMGVEVGQYTLADDGKVTINTAALPEGLYFVSLINQGRVYRTATFSLQR